MSILNAITSGAGGVALSGDTSGNLTIQSAGTNVVTFTSTGMITNVGSPAFSAYSTTTQSVTSTSYTKVTFDSELFDTNNNFASSRFTPTVAGYYQLNAAIYFTSSASTLRGILKYYKNGGNYKFGNYMPAYGTITGIAVGSCLIYMNGSTDYVEIYTYIEGTSPSLQGDATGQQVWFDGCLVRSA